MRRPGALRSVGTVTSPLLRLPVRYALVLALRDVGLSPDEIAEQLGLPPASMAATIALAEAKLAARLLEAPGDEVLDLRADDEQAVPPIQ